MNTMLAGFVSYGASEPLGLPEEYGLFCIITGAIIVGIAAYFLPKKDFANIDLDAPAAPQESVTVTITR